MDTWLVLGCTVVVAGFTLWFFHKMSADIKTHKVATCQLKPRIEKYPDDRNNRHFLFGYGYMMNQGNWLRKHIKKQDVYGNHQSLSEGTGHINWRSSQYKLQRSLNNQANIRVYSTLACETETLSALYSHALLIPTRLSKSKNQVVHEQKLKIP